MSGRGSFNPCFSRRGLKLVCNVTTCYNQHQPTSLTKCPSSTKIDAFFAGDATLELQGVDSTKWQTIKWEAVNVMQPNATSNGFARRDQRMRLASPKALTSAMPQAVGLYTVHSQRHTSSCRQDAPFGEGKVSICYIYIYVCFVLRVLLQ